jgi:hypothetical protein
VDERLTACTSRDVGAHPESLSQRPGAALRFLKQGARATRVPGRSAVVGASSHGIERCGTPFEEV